MAIKGLTDRGLSFPEIGQIRKGAKKDPKINRPGPDLTYFRVEFAEKEEEAQKMFLEKYGAQPDQLNIILPFNDIDRMWDAWLEAYTAGRMVARSDGEKFIYLVDTKTGEVLVKNGLDKEGKIKPYFEGQVVGSDYRDQPVKCKPTGRLKVILLELGRAAYFTVMTTSIHDIHNISSQLEAFKAINGGQIAGIPLVLRRRPKAISTPSKEGPRVRRIKYLLSIEADPEWVRRKLTEVKQLALPGNGATSFVEEEPAEDPAEEVTGEIVDDEAEEGEWDGQLFDMNQFEGEQQELPL